MARTQLYRRLRQVAKRARLKKLVENPSRRDFFRLTSQGVLASLALSACRGGDVDGGNTKRNQTDSKGSADVAIKTPAEDIVIVGGGVAGLTCAYRLKQLGIGSSLYEASERWGGRIRTQKDFNKDKQFVELGGELVGDNHIELINLARELGLELEGFYENDPTHALQEILYYNGRTYSYEQLWAALETFFAELDADIRRIFPNGFYEPTYQTNNSPTVVQYDQMSLAAYLDGKGNSAEKWAIDYMSQALETEYGGSLANQSSFNFIMEGPAWLGADYGYPEESHNLEWGRIKGGNQGLIDRLQQELVNKIPLHLDHQLVKVAHDGSAFSLTFKSGATTKEVKARQVVLAVPFSTLRMVEGIGDLELSPQKKSSIASFTYGTNAKFMVSFTNRIWRQAGALPASQGMVMSDLASGMLWETSRIQAGSSGILTNYLGGERGRTATESRLNTILGDCETLWPGARNAYSGDSALLVWNNETFIKGAYSSPAPGHYTSFLRCEGKPELDGALLFIGEHTSEKHRGHMNGGVETGKKTAELIARNGASLWRRSG